MQATKQRILAIDFVRIFIIAAVITAHLVASGSFYNSQTSGVAWMFVHTSRNIFFVLMALVLTYSTQLRYKNARTFYLRRFPLIVVPYAVWTAVYMLYNSGTYTNVHSLSDAAVAYGTNLITADAMYHLYFLLVTMQLYLLFPLLRHLRGLILHRPLAVLAVSTGIQLLFTALMHYNVSTHGVLDWWLNNPDKFLWSYQLYFIMGMTIALHLTTFRTLVLRFRPFIYAGAVGVVIGALTLYGVRELKGVSPDSAAEVFQPYLVVETMAFTLALFAAGFAWFGRGARFKRAVALIAQNSFGIYLAHLIILVPLLNHLQPAGSDWITVTATIVIGVPAIYALSFGLAELLRHTPLSLAFIGRKQSKQPLLGIKRTRLQQERDTV